MVHPCRQMVRGGVVVDPCSQMFRGGGVLHTCRQMFRGGSVLHTCRQMFRGGGVVHPCRQLFRGGGVVHTCRQNQLDDQKNTYIILAIYNCKGYLTGGHLHGLVQFTTSPGKGSSKYLWTTTPSLDWFTILLLCFQ